EPVAHPSGQRRTQRSSDANSAAHDALRQIEAAGAARDVGNGERDQHAEPSSSCTATSRRGSTTTMNNRPRMGNAAKPMSRIGRRPHRCVQRPTQGEKAATTICGAAIEAATNVVAHALERMVTMLAISGSIAAFASWKTVTHAANVKSGRLV